MRSRTLVSLAFVICTCLIPRAASASVIPIGIGAFGPGSTLTDFTGLVTGTEVNGLVVGGLTFSYSLGNGQVTIGGVSGVTNNVSPPSIQDILNTTGILGITVPGLVSGFGYGYALANVGSVPNATTISLFNGVTPVGSLSYNAVPDPFNAGGFAGIASTLPFNRVELTFNGVGAPTLAFAVDNIRTTTAAIPEPVSILFVGTGLGLIGLRRLRARR